MNNLSIDNKKIDLFYKLVDKACMIYYNELGIDYLEAFIKVSESLTKEFDEMKLSKKTIDKLNGIYEEISNTEFLNEEVRLACELIFVKGLKHRNVLLDFMTPDVINYLYVHIIKSIIDNVEGFDKEEITILDTVLGTSNLLQTVINNIENYKDINVLGVGIEKDELLVHLSQSFSELLGNEIIINFNDALKKINCCANIIVGDFGETKDVYQIIIERLNNLADDGFFIYVINNDFFTYASDEFRKTVSNEATLIGLIMLPLTFTNANHVGKSILIGRKGNLSDYQMAIVKMEEDLSQENLEMTFVKIYNMFKEIGGNKNA
ncbi:MAG: hypothetical protein IJO27_02615 [Bacilli bacterium]|nr:hypothetical protein [Bacilli bacterium]